VSLRHDPRPEDVTRVRAMMEAVETFSREDIGVHTRSLEDRLARGAAAGRQFVLADYRGHAVAAVCYAPIPTTTGAFEVLWMVVRPDFQGRGLGRAILRETERRARRQGAERLYLCLSGRPALEQARRLCRSSGYREEAALKDFYGPGDDRRFYVKILAS
jgi:GNAT superfamily N-acetyltransferase